MSIRRDLLFVLGIKALLLILLWALFFTPSQRPVLDEETIARRITAPPES